MGKDTYEDDPFVSKVLNMNPDSVNPEIAAMVKEIINQFQYWQVERSALAAASLYKWALQIIQKIESEEKMATLPTEPVQPDKRIAFRIERQRAIFHIHPERYREYTCLF